MLATAIGSAGGFVADRLGVPLGWMIGAMLATGIVAMAGMPLWMPRQLRFVVLSVIGVNLGASFTPGVLAWLVPALVTITVMCLTAAAATAVAAWGMARWLRVDAVTAITSCVPGGFSSMLVFAREYGGDEETVAMVHLVRLVLVVVTFPLALRLTTGAEFAAVAAPVVPHDLAAAAALFVLALATGLAMRLPVACLVAPMLAGAVLQVTGLTTMALPGWPLVFALVGLGTLVGCDWRSLRGAKLWRCVLAGLALGVFLIVTMGGMALVIARAVGLAPWPTLLGYTPGGVAEISLVAVSLGVEPSYVVLHQLMRVVFIIVCLPFLFAWFKSHRRPRAES